MADGKKYSYEEHVLFAKDEADRSVPYGQLALIGEDEYGRPKLVVFQNDESNSCNRKRGSPEGGQAHPGGKRKKRIAAAPESAAPSVKASQKVAAVASTPGLLDYLLEQSKKQESERERERRRAAEQERWQGDERKQIREGFLAVALAAITSGGHPKASEPGKPPKQCQPLHAWPGTGQQKILHPSLTSILMVIPLTP